jgi:hypothetical protein
MRNFFRRKDLIKNHKKIATFLAVIVALVTAYLLILPAITLDNETASQDPGIEVEQSSQSPPSLPAPQDNQLGSQQKVPQLIHQIAVLHKQQVMSLI